MQQVIMPLCIFKIAKMSKPMKKILSSVKNFLQEYEDLGIEEIYSLRETNKNESEATNISLELLKKEGLKCQNCQLAQTRKNVVFGLGNQKAKLMIIGEGPGANEDAQGLPFVGRAGDLLTKMLLAIKIEREDVYITNIVTVSYTHLRAHETSLHLVCRLLLEKKKAINKNTPINYYKST
eukprot:TRINITY_DN21944_c0_g1_i2.p1 TRINITY_DN21944_c0_g1~~TRINITY_DN21944_c0_g1_i2.p1  ORF type:complete len:180 (-),score=35.06 TRINITY_DN21944_c0_g1_i2:28-567(-)